MSGGFVYPNITIPKTNSHHFNYKVIKMLTIMLSIQAKG